MNHKASLSAPPRRTRRIVLLGLAVLGLAGAAFVVRRPLMMSAPRCAAGQWHGCFDTFNGVVLMTLVALPLAALVAWALARRRRAAGVASAWRTSLAEVGMVHGTVPFLWLTMMPGGQAGADAPVRVSLVPLRDLVTMGPLGIVGNLLVLAALGFFAPMRFTALASVPRILALGAGCSVLVETAQYVLRLDRVSSVDDVLVNAAGAVLAALASRRWWRTTAETPADRPRPVPAPAPAPAPTPTSASASASEG
ncbi:VanZ family protein [Kitasatospora sp. NBC_00240]|uniref:VanZ family protein n=1 Tax=Kitasatospora sp. NBC_00240 TaxID=2903567 RepID=UPI00225B6F6D|nr:VanZ family protein [Kitasatospora sp. NBC_00240]MCX5214339.1 VanZ family protein [Kitasatospora sp. NBC_00240]